MSRSDGGDKKADYDGSRAEMTEFFHVETRTDNPSVMLRMPAPFAQGSQSWGFADALRVRAVLRMSLS